MHPFFVYILNFWYLYQMNIYNDNNDISRSIDVYVTDRSFSIVEYDLKPKVFDRERIFETDELNKILKIFKANSVDELLQILKEKFNANDAFDRVFELLKDKVKYKYNSFTS